MGLIPLRADPRLFEYPSNKDEDEISDQDSLRYELKVSCTWNPQAPKDSRRTNDIYRNSNGTQISNTVIFVKILVKNNFIL